MDLRFVTRGAAETQVLAAAFGRMLAAGDVVCLCGDLGAGKTTFTQGLAAGLDIPPEVVINSPTFTLLAEHPEGRVPLYHFDVYRLAGFADLYDLAFDEYVDGSGVTVIEWADRVTEALPDDVVFVTFETPAYDSGSGESECTRLLTFRGTGPRSAALIEALQEVPA